MCHFECKVVLIKFILLLPFAFQLYYALRFYMKHLFLPARYLASLVASHSANMPACQPHYQPVALC